MNVDDLVERLALKPHPEGGYYRETFRASGQIELPRGRRAASTAIWFLLPAGAFSAWHRVASDEVWHHYQGDPVHLHQLDDRGARRVTLGPDLAAGERPQAVVPAGTWQAAICPRGEGALCGCTVAPGFDYADFELPERAHLLERFPAHAALIRRFTR